MHRLSANKRKAMIGVVARDVNAMIDIVATGNEGIILPGRAAVSKFGVPWQGVSPNDLAFAHLRAKQLRSGKLSEAVNKRE